MNLDIYIISEGLTERRFIVEVLSPYMAGKGIFLHAPIIGETGKKGGDVRFSRIGRNIESLLKSRNDTKISLLVDYYGIGKDWPGYAESKKETDHTRKADIMNEATVGEIQRLFPDENRNGRFIPYVSMFEFEALYFSDTVSLSRRLGVSQMKVDAILKDCGEPERINDSPSGAPSKRLASLSGEFHKISTGIDIAMSIGIQKMREACPLFNDWLNRLEAIAGDANGQV